MTEKILETSALEYVEFAGDCHSKQIDHLNSRTSEILLVSECGTVDALRINILILQGI